MKKGAWLNGRPITVRQTNEYDVRVAKAQAIASAIISMHQACRFRYSYQYSDVALKIGEAINEK